MKKKPQPSSADRDFEPVVRAFARDRAVTAGRMMASLGLRVKGKIFAMHVRGDLVVKLPADRVAALIAERVGVRFDPRRDGRLMKEWLVVRPGKADWVALSKEAHRFVKGALTT